MTETPWTSWPPWLKWTSGIVGTLITLFAAGAWGWAAHIDNEVDELTVKVGNNETQHAADSVAARDMNAMIIEQIKSADKRSEARDKSAEAQADKMDNRIDFIYGEFNDQNRKIADQNEKLDKLLDRD